MQFGGLRVSVPVCVGGVVQRPESAFTALPAWDENFDVGSPSPWMGRASVDASRANGSPSPPLARTGRAERVAETPQLCGNVCGGDAKRVAGVSGNVRLTPAGRVSP